MFTRIEELTGQQIVERYGLTETLMNTAVRADSPRRPGYVGVPLQGVEVRLVADDGSDVEASDDETIGEVAVRGPNVFSGYLNRPTRPRRRSATAGSSPATSARARPTATGGSSAAARPT